MVMGLGSLSRGGLMLDARRDHSCCARRTGAAASASADRVARRPVLKSAIFQPQDGVRNGQPDQAEAPATHEAAGSGLLARAFTGTVLDASPQVICIADASGERRFALTAAATAWRGRPLDPAAVRPGDQAVVRLDSSRPGVADRIWANIGRVTGTIVEHGSDGLLVDEGSTRQQQAVVIPARAAGRIQVRFPSLQPGYLIDIIGIRRGGVLEGLVPATSQPAYRSDSMPAPALVSGHVPEAISGSATWHEPSGEPRGTLGVAYPAIDPSIGCAEEASGQGGRGYVRMPYLAIGSILLIRNECTGSSCALPVTSCAAVARLFNDRCVTCSTSRRGRVADLTMASFVALGGELEQGCFSATIAIGR
jgi:hypothetical protein